MDEPVANDDNTMQETLEEILNSVTGGFTQVSDIEQRGFDDLALRLDSLGEQTTGAVQGESLVIDSSQMETIQSGMGLLITEGFVLCCLLAACAGLMIWRILSGGWRG